MMSREGQLEIMPKATVSKALVVFVVATGILAALASMLVIDIGIKRHYMVLLMWTPGLGALIACKMAGIPLSSLGWGWGKARWHAAAYLTPLLYGLVAYSILWGTGLATAIDPKFIEEAGYHLGLVGWSENATLLMAIFIFAVVGMTWHLASGLGEEIGWRGFLTPALMRFFSLPVASLITGLLWALWHVPIILYTKYNAGPNDLGIQIANFTLLCVGISMIMGYLRVKSGSLWTGAVMHAAHNIFILSLFERITLKYEGTWRYAGEFGVLLPLVVALFALYVLLRAYREGLTGSPKQQEDAA